MTRIVVLGGGFAGLETVRALERELGERPTCEIEWAPWWLAHHVPRDLAIIRQPPRCPVCAHGRGPGERPAA